LLFSFRHCEERSDEAMQPFFFGGDGLLCFARTDDGYKSTTT
jgi:hypothetical protein